MVMKNARFTALTERVFNSGEPTEVGPPEAHEVHLWQVDLSERCWPGAFPEVLSNSERRRFARYQMDRDARRFALRRLALRVILAGYLRMVPEAVTLALENANGKLRLASCHGDRLCFSTSSSIDVGLIAVANRCQLGIDIEVVRPLRRFPEIAARVLTAAEAERLSAVPEDERMRSFFRVWSAKEALLKAIGLGLPGGLQRFEVSVDPRRAPVLLRDAHGYCALRLYAADPCSGYMGALATDLSAAEVKTFALPPGIG